MKIHLENTVYRDFVKFHILRPYQTLITSEDTPAEFSVRNYNLIPGLVMKNPEWTEKVFSRAAAIFETIDSDVFPGDLPAMVILTELAKRGVIIEYT